MICFFFFLIKLAFICPFRSTVYPFLLLAVPGRLVFMNKINAYPLASGWGWLWEASPGYWRVGWDIYDRGPLPDGSLWTGRFSLLEVTAPRIGECPFLLTQLYSAPSPCPCMRGGVGNRIPQLLVPGHCMFLFQFPKPHPHLYKHISPLNS